MTTELVEVEAPQEVDTEMCHVKCLCSTRALCGQDLSGAKRVFDRDRVSCVVCIELDAFPCEWCGW